MHFWIDKRSQGYGFGRSRAGFVAASLSGSGYDFYHPPRRNKPMMTPIHRFQNENCRSVNRPNVHRPQVHRSSHHHNNHHHYHQDHHNPHAHHHTPRPPHHEIQTHAEVNTTNYEEPADYSAVMHQYQSHLPIELEQGALGLNAIRPTNDILPDDRTVLAANVASVNAVHSTDSQMIPSHLKCGMWASLALATVFLAAFQGSGLEIVIFCAFSATFFIACTVSLCRVQPRNLNIPPPSQLTAVTANVNDIEIAQIAHLDQCEPHVANVCVDPIAPPPPYHIACILNPKIDDSPPPSYDKLNI